MPPKRASTGAGAPASKRSRRSTDAPRADAPTPDAEAEAPTLPKPRRSGRWAKPLSGSANADMSYKIITQDPLKAYEYELLCKPPFDNGEDEEDEDEDQPGKCDGGKTCLCMKPASEKPDHPWKMTLAGQTLFCTQRAMCDLRDPDGFSMYTFNDHSAYGMLEVLQNLMLDYEAASKNYKEQWAICEALGFFLSTTHGAEVALIDDGVLANATIVLIGRLFLSMLSRLEREQVFSKDSEIQNLGLIMALFMGIPDNMGLEGLSSPKELLAPKTAKKYWCPAEYDNYIVAYARKYDIKLLGPSDIDERVAKADSDVNLPEVAPKTDKKADPFGFADALSKYQRKNIGVLDILSKRRKQGSSLIGGDALDITTWTSAERKKYAFDGNDPLPKEVLDALKAGDVVGRG